MMERRYALPLLLIAVVVLTVIPMSDSDAAITGSDISVTMDHDIISKTITVDTYEVSAEVTVKNGRSETINAYIWNQSSEYMTLKANSVSASDIDLNLSSDVDIIGPIGDDRYTHISTIKMVVSIDNFTDTHQQVLKPTVVLRGETEDVKVTVIFDITVNVDNSYSTDGSYNKFFGVFPNTLPEPLNNVWVTVIVTLILWMAATVIAIHLIVPLIAHIVGYKKSVEEKEALKRGLTKSVSLLMFIIAINECVMIAGASVSIQHPIQLISNFLIVVVLAYIIWQIYLFFVTAFIMGIDNAVDVKGLDPSLIPLFKMIGRIIICVGAVAAILASFGVDLGGILVSAGVVSLGITLGAQNTLNQFFSGIVLLSTRPFQKGDYVKIGTEVYIVEKVRLMFTEFRNWAKDQIITMPNNAVTGATLVNLTRESKATVIYVYMTVAYSANLSLAKELMIRAAKMHPHVLHDGTASIPSTRLTGFLDSGIEYRLSCTVDEFENSASYAGQLREIIFKLFKDNGVEIPYNRLEVTLLPCDGKKRPGDDTD